MLFSRSNLKTGNLWKEVDKASFLICVEGI